jgi:hypothetical protein
VQEKNKPAPARAAKPAFLNFFTYTPFNANLEVIREKI